MLTKQVIDEFIDTKTIFIECAEDVYDVLLGLILIILLILMLPAAILLDLVFLIPEIIIYIIYWRYSK